MTIQRKKFSSQADPELLIALHELARSRWTSFNAVLEDAMRDYITTHLEQKPRPNLLWRTVRASVEENHRLGELLVRRS